MKTKCIAAGLLMLAIISCNKKAESPEAPAAAEAPAAPAPANGKSCYEYVKHRDTVSLALVMNANNANGEMIYNLEGKDKNTGTLSGIFIGDTLYADYSFKSEGTNSVRETVFLRTGDVLTEGHGEMEEKNNKMCFRNPKKVVFDASGIVLSKTDCR
jgi:hypothetical protein